MKTCSKCGYNLRDDELFCKICGSKYEDAPSAPVSPVIVESAKKGPSRDDKCTAYEAKRTATVEQRGDASDEQIKAVIDELRNASIAMEKASERLTNAYQSGLELISRYSGSYCLPEVKTEPLPKPIPNKKELKATPAGPRVCNKCGCRANPTDVFCGTCGEKIGG